MGSRHRRIAVLLLALIPLSCAPEGVSRSAITSSIESRIVHADTSSSIAGERLLLPDPVARFYKAHQFKAAWSPDAVPHVIRAIQGVYADGLNPADYHVATIQKLDEQRKHASTIELEAALDLLLTDAVAAVFDHVRYGKVRPVRVDHRWNVDPRDGALPLDQQVERVVGSSDPVAAIEAEKPDHFIYKGLKRELARLRGIASRGGWGTISPGKSIEPGDEDPRVPRVRARLAASGEMDSTGVSDPTPRYDARLASAVRLFQARHRLPDTGILDAMTIESMNVPADARAAQVRVNLERARWVLGGLRGDFLLVNLPAFKAYFIKDDRNVWENHIQIGESVKPPPTFRAEMRAVVFNPDWTVPQAIVATEILPELKRGRNVLGEMKVKVFDVSGRELDPAIIDWGRLSAENFPYTLKHPPGPGNPIGKVMFDSPNKYGVYLHDMPGPELAGTDGPFFKHGSLRVTNAADLAQILLQGEQKWNRVRIAQVIAGRKTVAVELRRGPAVLVVYWTVSVGAGGEVRYAQDIFKLDQSVLDLLNGPPRAG
jgi:L,D-transpeptidase YcbB